MSKKALIIGVAVVLILALIGGGIYYFSSHQGAQAARIVNIGYIPVADCGQLYVAIEQGFFKAKGIQVKLASFAGGAPILQALGAGSLDIGFSNVVSLILARSQGLDFVSITGGPGEDGNHAEHAILVAKDSPINTPKDLEGKTIAINTFKNIDEVLVKAYLAKNGVDLSAVKFVTIPFPQMEPVLLSGQVQAVAAIEPFVTAALQHGSVRVLGYDYVEVQPVTEISTYVVSRAWAQKNQSLVKDFADALNQATIYANTHTTELKAIVAKYANVDPQLAKNMAVPFYTQILSAERLLDMQNLMVQTGLLDQAKSIDVRSAFYQPQP